MEEGAWDWLNELIRINQKSTDIHSILEPYKQRILEIALKDTIKNENTGELCCCPNICEHVYLKNNQIKIDCGYFSGLILLDYNK